jgi:triacylglycerol esterase/lipase EstA (alpha/beta hydrolase family)
MKQQNKNEWEKKNMSTKNDNCIVQPYMFFNGRCEEALEFYRKSVSAKTLIAMFATVTASFAAPTIVQAAQEKPAIQTATPKPTKSGHAAVNGVNYYYAVYGTGEPLLLLHGGMGQIEMFGPNLTKLAQSRQVIGVDLQGHGRTSLGDREISLVDIGNDMAGVLKKLGHDKVDVLGYSMGGGVAFQFAAQHPEMVRRLALVSTPYSQDTATATCSGRSTS